jgi:hypothetical protein
MVDGEKKGRRFDGFGSFMFLDSLSDEEYGVLSDDAKAFYEHAEAFWACGMSREEYLGLSLWVRGLPSSRWTGENEYEVFLSEKEYSQFGDENVACDFIFVPACWRLKEGLEDLRLSVEEHGRLAADARRFFVPV